MSDAPNLSDAQPIIMTKADLTAFADDHRVSLAERPAEVANESQFVVYSGLLVVDTPAHEATVDGVTAGSNR